MLINAHISGANGNDFTKSLIRYGMAHYKEEGSGLIAVREDSFMLHADGRVEAMVTYLSTGSHQTEIPEKAYDLVQKYDPEKEVVLSLFGTGGMGLTMVLKADSDWLLADERIESV